MEKISITSFAPVSLLILLGTGSLYSWDNNAFSIFLGPYNPLIVVGGLTVLAYLIDRSLRSVVGLTVDSEWSVFWDVGFAVVLGAAMIVFDYLVVFPDDINVLLPEALFYYSSFGYIVEVVFHLLPFWLLISALDRVSGGLSEKRVFFVMIIVACLEPVFQVSLGFSSAMPMWVMMYIGAHIFAMNLQQLRVYRRYGFIHMFAFRLIYYLIWHIVWGKIRLGVLF